MNTERVGMVAICGLVICAASVAQDDGAFFDDALPPPGFIGSQPDFFDLPDEDLDLDFDPPAPEAGKSGETPVAAGDAGETVPLGLVIPDPYFGGTPLDYSSPNLETPNYKPRPAFPVPGDVTNIALGKTVTSSAPAKYGKLEFLTDGDTRYDLESLLTLPVGAQWIQIDLGAPSELFALALWHFHEGERVVFDVLVQVADDAAFTDNVRTVFNNDRDNSLHLGVGGDLEYIESYRGKFLDLERTRARYIRFHSNGNTTDSFNLYVEAQVFGRPLD